MKTEAKIWASRSIWHRSHNISDTLLLTSYGQLKRHLKTHSSRAQKSQCIATTYAIQILLLTYKLTTNLRTGCDGMGICCEKKMMTGQRNTRSMKQRAPDQEEDQREPGQRLRKRTVKHVIEQERCYGSQQMKEVNKECLMMRMGVSE